MTIIFHENNTKSSLIHFYALKGDYETYINVKESLPYIEFKELVFQSDDYGYFPLFYALLGGNKEIVLDLLSEKNLFITEKDREKKVEWLDNEYIINIALNSRSSQVFTFVLDLIELQNINVYNTIHEMLVLNERIDIPFYYEYIINKFKLSNYPLYIDPFKKNEKGESLIYFSISNDNEYIFNKLCSLLKFDNFSDNNPFSFFIFNLNFFTITERLRFKYNRTKYLKKVINKYGINFVNKPDNNNISLGTLAIEYFDEDILSVLVNSAVDPTEQDKNGDTFLHTCVNRGSIHSYNILRNFFSYSNIVIKNNADKTVYDMANMYFKDVLEYRFHKLKKEKPLKIEERNKINVKQIE